MDRNTEEEWLEFSDEDELKASLTHIARIDHSGKVYVVLAIQREDDNGEVKKGLILFREETSNEGERRYTALNDEREVMEIVNRSLLPIIKKHLAEPEDDFRDEPQCGHDHCAGEFCVCGMKEYLQ